MDDRSWPNPGICIDEAPDGSGRKPTPGVRRSRLYCSLRSTSGSRPQPALTTLLRMVCRTHAATAIEGLSAR